MSNADRVVLALGGAGTVGSGIVKALLDKGKMSLFEIRSIWSLETITPALKTMPPPTVNGQD